jgi:hypothetical protein
VREYWLKPFGTSTPRRLMPDSWTERFSLDPFPLMSGPSKPERPPQMARGDRVLFHAVGHVRLFAAAVILDDPELRLDSRWAPRWPWLYRCRVDVWVPRISSGPRTTAVAPRRAIGRLQRGSQYARLEPHEYEASLGALLACETVQIRTGWRPSP